ncbi:YdcF family protein [Bacteriovorax sp. BSW11_IV]|uniref:YdcF family protein n=1 Tax=Bacteriovorax sp. BSW11_IV TaxID=1353529 RepID=UPI0003F781C5|nr:YdcF family protein [Bacteriovorax sp. BSW11_IV]
MFKSKYLFETRRTRTLRYLKNTSFLIFIGGVFYTIFCLLFLIVSKNETTLSKEAFFKRPPDLIVVFTGDQGRIPHAMELAKEYNQSNIFITGVYSKNSVNTLIQPLNLEGLVDPDLLNIDYLARNTVENVLATLQFLRTKNGIKTVLIVSSDYHIMRIKLILDKVKVSEDDYNFNYAGVPTDYSRPRSLKILYTEAFKYLRTYFFLLLWESEQQIYLD